MLKTQNIKLKQRRLLLLSLSTIIALGSIAICILDSFSSKNNSITGFSQFDKQLELTGLSPAELKARNHNSEVRNEVPRPPVKPRSEDGLHTPDLDYNSNTVLNQGDRVITVKKDGSEHLCTVGYADHERKAIHIAAHCLHETKKIYTVTSAYTNEPLLISKSTDNMILSPGHNRYGDYPRDTEHDYGIVYLDKKADVTLGHNSLSGKNIVNRPLRDGEEVCYYSSVSQKVTCSVFLRDPDREVSDDEIVFLPEKSYQGDSGGPLWLKNGGGLVGILSANSDQSAQIPRTFFDYAYRGIS